MRRPRIVVLGMLTKMPVAGVVWQYLHYLLGFERLGYEAWYVEDHGINPSMFSTDSDPGTDRAAAFIASMMRRGGLDGRWAYHALHDDGAVHGLSDSELADLYRSAALIVNMHGGTTPRPEHASGDRLVYLQTDPGQLQAELREGRAETVEFLEPHAAFFTFAESIGADHCGLPVSDRFEFVPTRQPVVLDLWTTTDGPWATFTTIGNWRQRWRDIVLDGEPYTWSKHHEFTKVLDLPARTGARFELALSALGRRDGDDLQAHGWRVVDAAAISSDCDVYRTYIQRSKGELTVAKDQNVRLRTGWFSDRSATYLASGRPVITQDTGFGHHLPVGEGLFAFSCLDEAADAVAAVQADPIRHGLVAADIAREHFDADKVLKALLAEVGV
jgi:hypothetical protein